MSSATARLAQIDDTWSDEQVATLIADAMTENEREPYCFAMNHDAGPPEFKGSPLRYDFSTKGWVGIETMMKGDAMTWLVKALMHGYTVSMAGPEVRRRSDLKPRKPYGDTTSIKRSRTRAEFKRRVDDDDIPF